METAPSRSDALRLARLFHAETATDTFAHLGVAAVLVAFIWTTLEPRFLLSCAGVIVAAVGLRFGIRRSARALYDDATALAARTRLATLLPAAAWGGVTLAVADVVPGDIWSRHLLALAALVAAATATHMADRLAYHLFSAFILVPAALGTIFQGYGPGNAFDLLVVLGYGAMMALIHERAHAQLRTRISTAARLESATLASTREKEFLDGVLASVPDAMALVDPNDGIPRMNEEFRSIVVPATSGASALTLDDVTGSGLGAVLAGAVRAARETGAGDRECRTSAGGETRWFVATARRASGHADGWVFLQLRDISGLRSAEEARRRAEADLADMVESAHDLIWRVDNRGRWTFLNAAAEEIYGESRSRLLGTNLLDRVPAPRRDADRRALRTILDGGTLVNHLAVHYGAGGEERWMSFSGSPLRDETDAVVGAHGIARDVTAEVKAREALEELARRNSLVRSLLNASDDMVFYKDVDSVYRGSNDAFLAFVGLDGDSLVGRRDGDLFPPALAEANRARDREVMERRTPIRYEANYDATDPHRVWETVQTPYVSDDGEVLGVLGISREMTEWKEAQERIQRMAEEAERAAQMKSAFLANMSHEIRTPMNGVLGMSELLQDTALGTEQRQYVDVIRSSAENLLRILNDILDFSKIEAGHLSLEEVPFDLHREVGDAVRVMAIAASRRGNELMVDIAPDVPRWVEGDPGRLRQIITNLVGNAVKFTEDGEVEVGARVMAAPEAGDGRIRVRFQVRDSGIGIAEDKMTLIFQEFSQADASVSRRYGGTGLGLAISRKLVRLMGGEMHLESAEGRGSTFSFDIVVTPCDRPVDAGPKVERGPVDLSGMRILVVDDNATNRRILWSVLGEAGATVHPADGGEAALHRLEELLDAGSLPDLVVMDLEMPDLDGLDAVERMRSTPDGPFRRIPVMVLSSASRPDDTARVRSMGVEGYFLKPLPRPDLLRAVAAIHAGRDRTDGRVGPVVGIAEHMRRHRVLVAEDNPVNRLVACAILEKAGYRVEVAENGAEAVAAVRDDDFEIVLMDVQMPEMDGMEATRTIREMESRQGGRRLPIIALTAHALQEERDRCLAAGMDDFLSKPFRGEDLLALLERWSSDDDDDPAEPVASVAAEPASAGPLSDGDDGPPVDLDGYRTLLEEAGIGMVFESTLTLFRDDLPGRSEALHGAWEDGDHRRVAEAAHAIKSAAGNVRATRLHALLGQLEGAAGAGDRDRMEALWPSVATELVRVESFLASR